MKEFSRDQTLAALAFLGKPAKRSREEAIAAGERVQRKQSKKKDEPFMSVTPFSELLDYHDATKHSLTDLAHTFANTVKQLSNAVSNQTSKKNKSAFSTQQVAMEVGQLGRFSYLKKASKAEKKKKKTRSNRVLEDLN